MIESDLEARIRRIASSWGVPASHVHFDFRVYSAEDGGPCWSVYVVVPATDRRKAPNTKHFPGYTLDEAEECARRSGAAMITMTDNDFAASLIKEQKDRIRALALGRIFRLAARPEQPGDAEAYERAKRAFLATYTDEELAAMRDHSLPSPYSSPVPRHPKDT